MQMRSSSLDRGSCFYQRRQTAAGQRGNSGKKERLIAIRGKLIKMGGTSPAPPPVMGSNWELTRDIEVLIENNSE
ncbi:hypothetical protein NDU88_002366 [Pleurodeles waltl]|uniref:Uncharacterized protein n=1 Tax=Pleurodeles waltl TaxID=8319 RepID=A0AAV7UC55_PLEWA|nr:hypothetical protein NDU88_002366 [Pleurodeles waltl]